MHVINVEMTSHIIKIFKDLKENSLERNPMNIRNVGKPTYITVPYKDTKGLTL